MAFFASFIQYIVIAAIMVVLAFCGILAGKKLRQNKDKKDAALAASDMTKEN